MNHLKGKWRLHSPLAWFDTCLFPGPEDNHVAPNHIVCLQPRKATKDGGCTTRPLALNPGSALLNVRCCKLNFFIFKARTSMHLPQRVAMRCLVHSVCSASCCSSGSILCYLSFLCMSSFAFSLLTPLYVFFFFPTCTPAYHSVLEFMIFIESLCGSSSVLG